MGWLVNICFFWSNTKYTHLFLKTLGHTMIDSGKRAVIDYELTSCVAVALTSATLSSASVLAMG
jgi:hypothetical protein